MSIKFDFSDIRIQSIIPTANVLTRGSNLVFSHRSQISLAIETYFISVELHMDAILPNSFCIMETDVGLILENIENLAVLLPSDEVCLIG